MKMHRLVLSLLLIGSTAWAEGGDGWKELREKSLTSGLPPARVDQILAECKQSGIGTAEAAAMFAPAYTAQKELLPSECILLRIEEGLAKQIPAAGIETAAKQRLENLRRADRLVMSIRQGRGNEHSHLILHTCMALESGLPETVLSEVFNRPVRFRYGRLIHVIEAGETLQLAGLEPQQTQRIMNDCIDRDLNGSEVARAIDFVLTAHGAGKDFNTIRETLWVHSD